MKPRIVSALLIAGTAACSSVFGGGLQLDISLVVMPVIVRPEDSFTAVLTIRNTTVELVTLQGAGCVAGITVFRGDEAVRMQGADFACTDILMHYDVPARDSLVVTYSLVAALQRDGPPVVYDVRPPTGEYVARTWMTVDLPNVESRFVVEN